MTADAQAVPKLSFTPGCAFKDFVLGIANTPDCLDQSWLNDMALRIDKLTVMTPALTVHIVNRNGSGWVELPDDLYGLTGGVSSETTLIIQRDCIMQGNEALWEAPQPPRAPSN